LLSDKILPKPHQADFVAEEINYNLLPAHQEKKSDIFDEHTQRTFHHYTCIAVFIVKTQK